MNDIFNMGKFVQLGFFKNINTPLKIKNCYPVSGYYTYYIENVTNYNYCYFVKKVTNYNPRYSLESVTTLWLHTSLQYNKAKR